MRSGFCSKALGLLTRLPGERTGDLGTAASWRDGDSGVGFGLGVGCEAEASCLASMAIDGEKDKSSASVLGLVDFSSLRLLRLCDFLNAKTGYICGTRKHVCTWCGERGNLTWRSVRRKWLHVARR
ncbi:hypothetical protein PR003_g7614 [Phytophthora rubi]|uniref:Uncharacterized protein n=1 Tax=Phytophthora rubi TaxID=129364 RepID=A0A6A4FNY3_9STRA|nr:hypothetical protein PR001_g6974 [Phytophthora rubi]KAE9346065.1 hypothetical protein PR003_g7614 [Phytophthora rubi]